MGYFKIKGKLVIVFLLLGGLNLFASSYEEFLKEQNSQYTQYKDNINKEFKAYKKAYDDAFNEFKAELKVKWPEKKPKITTKHKWVEYSKNLNQRKTVDFEKEEINLEVIAKTEAEAKKKIDKMFNDVVTQDISSAFKNDILEQKIVKKLKKRQPIIKSRQKIIANILNNEQKKQLKKRINTQKLVVKKYQGKFIYKANVKLPSNSTVKKAKQFKSNVVKSANKEKIPASLVYAIMHSESSFNPMARSHIPAYGLMQIVPRTAGIDSYKYLYKKKKLLSSSYLYNSKQNIKIGSAYLHILYYRYLKKIKDPQSRLYCAIAAYNTGAGNVAKAFIGNTNINKASVTINKMNADEVYKRLMKKLPYNETKHYLKKVTNRVSAYNKLLKTTL
ncbi:MAG: murein transglycosylase domain-containing protein [Campylobacterota bacterium]|nr:murein transglycosylase domain-containing protein [Campylobacterota bacterium]